MKKKIADIYKLISFTDFIKFLFLLLLLVINAILEVVSIGSIVPVYKSIIDPMFFQSYQSYYFQNIINYIASLSSKGQIIFVSLIFIVIFLFKTILNIATIKYNLNLIKNLKIKISLAIFKIYSTKNYYFFIQNSSSALVTNLLKEVNELCDRFIFSFINIILELLTIIFIISFLIYIDPDQSILIFLIFGFLFFAYNLLVKKKISKSAEQRQIMDVKKYSILNNYFRSVKEIKSNQVEIFFYKMFEKSVTVFENVFSNFLFIQIIAKPFFEFFILLALIIFFIFKLQNNVNLQDIFFSITVLFISAFRGLPCLFRLTNSYANMKFSLPSLKIIVDIIKLIRNNKEYKNFFSTKDALNFKNKIEFKEISFKYPGSNNYILQNFNFKLIKKQKICIVGKSGSGKTTFVDLLIGLLKPTGGSILVDGIDIKEMKGFNKNFLLSASYIPQDSFLLEESIEQNILLGNQYFNSDKFREVLNLCKLNSFVDSLPAKEKTFVGEGGNKFSGGQKQRISIARSFYNSKEIIIFDEPLNALDLETKKIIFNNIFKYFKDKTIICILHDKKFLRYFDQCYEIKDKKITNITIK